MQVHGPVGHGAVKIDGDAGDGDMCRDQSDRYVSPNWQLEQSHQHEFSIGMIFK
jgi:hypothetical protein